MATKKSAEVTIEDAMPPPAMVEDMTAKEIPGASPDDVFAELQAIADGRMEAPSVMAPVDLSEMPQRSAAEENRDIENNGGRVDGDILTFGDRVFWADPAKRKTVPNQANLATGPRMTKLPVEGEFLPNTKTFRRVPFRTANGQIRHDN